MKISNSTPRSLFWGVIIVVASLPAFAGASPRLQSSRIEVTVKDQDGVAIAGAEVTLDLTPPVHRITSPAGVAVFEKVASAGGKLSVHARGFAPREIDWRAEAGSARAEVVLTPETLPQEITITAARTETRLNDTPASILTLSREDLSATAALTLDDALRQVPGFTLFRRSGSRTANPTSQGVSLRGVGASGASRAVVLSDDIPINDPFGGWIYWGRVPRESIGRVEVLQGGASSLYGSDALGGVINVVPRDTRQSTLSFETSYGNEDTPDASLFAAGRLKGWGAQLAAEAFHTDGYILVDDVERGRVDTKAGGEHSDVELTIDRMFSGDQGRIFARGSIFGESRENGTPLQINRTHIRQLALGTDWQSQVAGSFAGRFYGGTQVYDQTFSAIAADRNSEALTRSQRVPAQQIGATGQWSRAAGSRQTLVAGADFREVRGASDELVISSGRITSAVGASGREHNLGVFAEDIIRITPAWLLTVGIRGDRWVNYDALSVTRPLVPQPGNPTVTTFPDRTETAFSPRLALLHKITENLSVFGSGYRSFRAPTLNELYRSFRVGNVLTLANDKLLAERLTGAEGGVAYGAFHQRLNVRGTFFWSEINRPIANVTLAVTPALITRQRQNLGRTRSQGFEIDGEAKITSVFSITGGYQFVDASVLDFPANTSLEGLRIPQVPRHQFTFQTRYSNPRIVILGIQARAVSSQFDDDQNQFRLASYFTLDALASRPIGHGVELFAAVENLFNQRYAVGRTPVETLGPPILARFGVRLRIGPR
jgi:outer membrane receptor protein involved in Fe transport